MLSKKKPFVGSMTMDREGLVASDRIALVGVISLDNRPLAGGAHIVEQLDEATPARLDRPHQLRLLFAGARQIHRAGAGQGRQVAARHARLFVSDPLRKRFGPVEIVSHHFFDPDGSRMHG